LHCQQRMKAREILRNLPGVRSVGIFGDRIHAVLEDDEKTRLRVESLLQESGLEILSMKRISPSLEDVFVTTIPVGNVGGSG